jgi:hypothetical protein
MAFLGKGIKRKAVKNGLPVLGAWAAKTLISKSLNKIRTKKKNPQREAVGKALVWGVSAGAAAGLLRYAVRRKSLGY